MSDFIAKQGRLSSRSEAFLRTNPQFAYTKHSIAASSNPYHPTTNPTGSIPLAVAENKLNSELVLNKINSVSPHAEEILNYTWQSGLPSVRGTVASFMRDYLFDGIEVNPDHLIISPGCCSILHQLSLLLCEADDRVIVPTPYYPAFNHDFFNMGKAIVIDADNPVSNKDDIPYEISVDTLERVFEQSITEGKSVKALLLTNPSNPLGIIYNSDSILDAISWCRRKGLHVIMDEIYALSTFSTDPEDDSKAPRFASAVSLLNNDLRDDVHVLWSLSKDFGASGLRFGVVYSQNSTLLKAMAFQNDAFMVSNLMQSCAAKLLEDRVFVDEYLKACRRALRKSFVLLESSLRALGIPLVGGGAGIFVFANFRRYLPEDSFEGELQLFEELCKRGVVFTPGKSCHSQVPGYFRICFAWVSYESLEEAVKRIKEFCLSLAAREG